MDIDTAAALAPFATYVDDPWVSRYTRHALRAIPADIATAAPPQIDEMIRTVDLDRVASVQRGEDLIERLYWACGYSRVDSGKRDHGHIVWVWPVSPASMLEIAAATTSSYQDDVTWMLNELEVERAATATARALVEAGNAEYRRRGGWTRYWRVANSNGHVHTSMSCSTCYPSTRYDWPTQLSGTDAQGVVDAAGPLTCLVCFPAVREDILKGRPIRFDEFETPEQRDNRIDREAMAKARAAVKMAKGLTVDGSPLRVPDPTFGGWVELKTLRAGELRYVEWASDALFYADALTMAPNSERAMHWRSELGKYADSAAAVLAALATKHGTDLGTEYARYATKVEKKGRERIHRGW